jgi:hypothetical protein
MDWLEKLTGFCETSYDDTRAKLKIVLLWDLRSSCGRRFFGNRHDAARLE